LFYTVSADGKYTAIATGVSVVLIAIITLLNALDNSIAAAGQMAGGSASIIIHGISVVALFIRIDNSVAAFGHSASRTAGIRCDIAVQCAIVTLFGAFRDFVPADGVLLRFEAAFL
jgi:amino acid transporter